MKNQTCFTPQQYSDYIKRNLLHDECGKFNFKTPEGKLGRIWTVSDMRLSHLMNINDLGPKDEFNLDDDIIEPINGDSSFAILNGVASLVDITGSKKEIFKNRNVIDNIAEKCPKPDPSPKGPGGPGPGRTLRKFNIEITQSILKNSLNSSIDLDANKFHDYIDIVKGFNLRGWEDQIPKGTVKDLYYCKDIHVQIINPQLEIIDATTQDGILWEFDFLKKGNYETGEYFYIVGGTDIKHNTKFVAFEVFRFENE